MSQSVSEKLDSYICKKKEYKNWSIHPLINNVNLQAYELQIDHKPCNDLLQSINLCTKIEEKHISASLGLQHFLRSYATGPS